MNDPQKEQNERAKMSYSERLAHYEWEKAQLPRTVNDSQTYDAALRALAKKWRI